MIEDSNINVLKEFAKNTGRKIVYNIEQYPMSLYRQIPRYKSEIFIPNNSKNSSFFVLFSDPYTKIGEHTAYSGVFFPVSLPQKMEINIKLCTFIDKIYFSKTDRKLRSGNKSFDSQIIAKGKNTESFIPIIKNQFFQNTILNSLKSGGFLQISINEITPYFIPNSEDKSWFSIIDANGWITESQKIDSLFNYIEQVKEIIEK